MRSATLTRIEAGRIQDLHLRLDVLEQRGQFFRNPVSVFIATNGPANLGVKVSFQVYLTTGIDSVEILRNTARDYSTASTLQTYALSELTVNKPIVYYDHDKSIVNQMVFYWIRVIPKPSKFVPIVQGPQIVTVPPQADTSLNANNDPNNLTNFATVDSIDAGADATVRVYGTGGVGSSWMRQTGFGTTPTFPAASILHQPYTTDLWIVWDPSLNSGAGGYAVKTTFAASVVDTYIFAGFVHTVAAGGGGGVPGGGGGGGGGGGRLR